MDTRGGKAKFKNFRIFLDSACSFTIIIVMIVEKLRLGKDSGIQWHTQAEILLLISRLD